MDILHFTVTLIHYLNDLVISFILICLWKYFVIISLFNNLWKLFDFHYGASMRLYHSYFLFISMH